MMMMMAVRPAESGLIASKRRLALISVTCRQGCQPLGRYLDKVGLKHAIRTHDNEEAKHNEPPTQPVRPTAPDSHMRSRKRLSAPADA
ncbi:MAG TPA: hypothetical protein DHW63_05205 [Hyphomonadaceae bacterium]|nr:hypothetical protein [Hyphomonadaceae bacterium]